MGKGFYGAIVTINLLANEIKRIATYSSKKHSVEDDLPSTLRAGELEAITVLVFLLVADLTAAQHRIFFLVVVAMHRLTVTAGKRQRKGGCRVKSDFFWGCEGGEIC